MQIARKERHEPGPLFHLGADIVAEREGGSVCRLSFSSQTLNWESLVRVEVASLSACGQILDDAEEDGGDCSC